MSADPYIITTGKAVMALGGFIGSDKILTVAQLKQLIQTGVVRYFLLGGGLGGGGFGGGGFGGPAAVNADLTAWVNQSCGAVPASAYGSSDSSGGLGGFGGFGGNQLFDCSSKALSPASPSP